MYRKVFLTTLLIIILAALLLTTVPVTIQAQAPSAYDLISTVNGWRASSGLPAYQANGALMSAAQSHSEYQAAIGSWSHIGAGGTYEWDRAAAAGYGNGNSIKCDEAVAIANTSTSLETVVYSLWNDYDHRDLVLLNPNYVDAGAGIVEKDGLIYYTLDVCVTGSGSSNSSAANPITNQTNGLPTATREVIVPIQTSTPQDDGTIYHDVQPGQTLWGIAIAYGMKITEVVQLNNLSSDNPVIMAGQKLLLRPSYTPTITPTITQTSIPATKTPRPTATLAPTRPTFTPTASVTPTVKPFLPEIRPLKNMDRKALGIVIIAACGIGLIAVIIGSIKSR